MGNLPQLQAGCALGVFILWTGYSLFFCPYPKFCRLFIHLNQIVYLCQISMIMYSVIESQNSRIGPSYVLLILNGLQIVIIAIFSLLFVVKLIYGICQDNSDKKNNKIQNIYYNQNQNNESQMHLNETKNFKEHDFQSHIKQNIFLDQFQQSKSFHEKDFEQNSPNLQKPEEKKSKVKETISSQKKPDIQSIKQPTEGGQVIIRKKYKAVRRSNK